MAEDQDINRVVVPDEVDYLQRRPIQPRRRPADKAAAARQEAVRPEKETPKKSAGTGSSNSGPARPVPARAPGIGGSPSGNNSSEAAPRPGDQTAGRGESRPAAGTAPASANVDEASAGTAPPSASARMKEGERRLRRQKAGAKTEKKKMFARRGEQASPARNTGKPRKTGVAEEAAAGREAPRKDASAKSGKVREREQKPERKEKSGWNILSRRNRAAAEKTAEPKARPATARVANDEKPGKDKAAGPVAKSSSGQPLNPQPGQAAQPGELRPETPQHPAQSAPFAPAPAPSSVAGGTPLDVRPEQPVQETVEAAQPSAPVESRGQPARPPHPAPKVPAAPVTPVARFDPTDPDADRSTGLIATNIAKAYKKRPVLRDVSVSVQQGEAVGLLGPNGAGKTTCFYIITGLIAPDYGKITLDGKPITNLPMYRRSRLGIGYLPQEASIFRGLTVEQNIRSVLEIVESSHEKREKRLEELLAEFSVTHLRRTPSVALSGGERRRVEIARALASGPSFILLDEPLAGIDPIAVGDIRDLVRHLKNRGIGVLITDHNVRETLDIVDRAYILHEGTVLMEGDPSVIVADEGVRRVYLGDSFSL